MKKFLMLLFAATLFSCQVDELVEEPMNECFNTAGDAVDCESLIVDSKKDVNTGKTIVPNSYPTVTFQDEGMLQPLVLNDLLYVTTHSENTGVSLVYVQDDILYSLHVQPSGNTTIGSWSDWKVINYNDNGDPSGVSLKAKNRIRYYSFDFSEYHVESITDDSYSFTGNSHKWIGSSYEGKVVVGLQVNY